MKMLKVNKTDVLPLFVLLALGLHLVSLGWQAANTLAINRQSRKPAPALVQLVDGRPVRVASIGDQERIPEVVRRFVSETLVLMFNWNGTLPPTTPEEERNPRPDEGIKVNADGAGSGQLVTTASWQASFALSENFRPEFLALLAQLTPRQVFARSMESVLIIRDISEPEQIEVGKWKVEVIADRVLFDRSNQQGNAIKFNREIYVQAVPQPLSPLGDKASDLEKTIYSIRQAGLEIYAMRELERGNL